MTLFSSCHTLCTKPEAYVQNFVKWSCDMYISADTQERFKIKMKLKDICEREKERLEKEMKDKCESEKRLKIESDLKRDK